MGLKDDLLHWWDLDTTSWTDSHGSWNLTGRKDGGGSDPSINNTGGPDGGKCLVLDGTNYLDRTDVAWDGSGAARSLQIWARYSSLSTTQNTMLNHRSTTAGSILQAIVLQTSSTAARANLADGTSGAFFNGAAVSADTWYQIVLTTNGTNRHTIYVNGSATENTTSLAGTTPTGNLPFAIGALASGKTSTDFRHIGRACMAGIWERELSSDDVTALYNGGSGLRYAALDAASPLLSIMLQTNQFAGGVAL